MRTPTRTRPITRRHDRLAGRVHAAWRRSIAKPDQGRMSARALRGLAVSLAVSRLISEQNEPKWKSAAISTRTTHGSGEQQHPRARSQEFAKTNPSGKLQ